MNNMDGRWGRRIFGTVHKDDSITRFHLILETQEGDFITSTIRVGNEDLEQFPDTYGFVLNKMTESIESALNHTKGDQP
jgi:hypothetical protein